MASFDSLVGRCRSTLPLVMEELDQALAASSGDARSHILKAQEMVRGLIVESSAALAEMILRARR